MDLRPAESGLDAGFLPVDLDRLEEEFQRRESQGDWSWSSSHSSTSRSVANSAVPQSTSQLLPPVLSLLEDVKDSEDCESLSYASETPHQPAPDIEQREESKEEASLLSSQRETPRVKRPDSQKLLGVNFREGRFHRKLAGEQTESIVESSNAEEVIVENQLEARKEEQFDAASPAFFTFEESCSPPSPSQTPPPQELSPPDPSSPDAIVIEWEEEHSSSQIKPQGKSTTTESLQSPSSVLRIEETTVPQLSSAQVSTGVAEEIIGQEEKRESPAVYESERDREVLLGTQTSRRGTKLVRYRDIWPVFEKMDIAVYIQPEDSAIPAQPIPWWKKCCLGDREEQDLEASKPQRRRIYALQRVKAGSEEVHWDMLMSVWKLCTSVKEDCNRQGSHWARLGLSVPEPMATFQAANLLGLLNLLFFTSRYAKSALFLSSVSQGVFPFARLSCFITTAAVRSLREGLLESWIARGYSVYDVVNSYYAGMMVFCVERWIKSREKQWERLGKEVEMEGRRRPGAIMQLARSNSLLRS